MFSSGNFFRIEFSKLSNLNLKHGNDNFSLPFDALTPKPSSGPLSSSLHHYSYHHPASSLEHFVNDPLSITAFNLRRTEIDGKIKSYDHKYSFISENELLCPVCSKRFKEPDLISHFNQELSDYCKFENEEKDEEIQVDDCVKDNEFQNTLNLSIRQQTFLKIRSNRAKRLGAKNRKLLQRLNLSDEEQIECC